MRNVLPNILFNSELNLIILHAFFHADNLFNLITCTSILLSIFIYKIIIFDVLWTVIKFDAVC